MEAPAPRAGSRALGLFASGHAESAEVSAVIGEQTEQEPKKLKLMQLPCAGGIPVGAVGAVQRVHSSQLCTSKPAFQRESVGNHFCITAQYYVFTACKLPHVEKKTLE